MKNILFVIGVCVVVALGFIFLTGTEDETPMPVSQELREELEEPASQARQVYMSEEYDFSFEVPEGYDMHEYTPEAIAVGNKIENGFGTEVEVQVVRSDGEGGYQNLEAFLFESTRNMCAADGPNETIYCDEMIEVQPFLTQSGISGQVFYLNRVHERFDTTETEEDAFGPIFAVEMDVPGSVYSTLLVRPPANLTADEVDSVLVREIATTVQLGSN